MDDDRISQLPEQKLQNHILSLLPQNVAVGTCVLSKSWRHRGLTHSKFEFEEQNFPGTKQEFLSGVEKTLKRYDDQKLSIQEFVLKMLKPDVSESISLLDEWIPKVITNMGVKIFNLTAYDFALPSVVFQAEFLEELVLQGCKLNYQINNNCVVKLRALRRLQLYRVHLTTELFENLSSNNCPCLEDLVLEYCSGFTEFKLSNRSIKRLIIKTFDYHDRPIEAVNIDVANILYFEFVSGYLPSIFSFATTSRECKSRMEVWCSNADVLSTWPLKLHEFLKALSQSQISLDISYPLMYQGTFDGDCCEPVVVEHLCLRGDYWSHGVPELLDSLFRICRPRYIGFCRPRCLPSFVNSQELAESVWETLPFWQQDLEESSIQVLDENTNEWRSVRECAFPKNENIRLRLKWREI